MLEIDMLHDQPSALMRIYFDTGKGLNDEHSVALPVRQGKLTKRLCFVPFGTRGVRFSPLGTEGCFSITGLRLVWLTPRFALDRMAYRLRNLHPQYRGDTKAQVVLRLKEEARREGLRWKRLAIGRYGETFVHCSPEHDYPFWLAHDDRWREPGAGKTAAGLAGPAGLHDQPRISIMLLAGNAPEDWLESSVQSVMTQLYPHWELVIAGADVQSSEWWERLHSLASQDGRIRVLQPSDHRQVAQALNAALALARGDYLTRLSCGDQLADDALYHVAAALNRFPGTELLYSDHDQLDENGARMNPHFKPDWDPDLLLAQHYLSHLTVFRTEPVRDIGGYRGVFEGCEDYDLALRITSGLRSAQICHIPHVLYHQRVRSDGLAQNGLAEQGDETVSLGAVRELVGKKSPDAKVERGLASGSHRVLWPVPEPAPLVSLLIPTRDRFDLLSPCVDALLALTDYQNFEVLILDNQSSCEETLNYMASVSRDPRVRVLHWDHAFNYAAINNFGARHARGEILGLVNNDIEPINRDWLTEMVRQVSREEIGCVGAKLYYPHGAIQHAGVILGLSGVAGHAHRFLPGDHPGYCNRLVLVQNFSAVTAACLLVRRSVFQQVAGLTEELAVAFNDVDFCLKVRAAGYRNLWTPYAQLYHHESVSRGADNTRHKRKRAESEADYMRAHWKEIIENDPAYNPNLTRIYEDFSLR